MEKKTSNFSGQLGFVLAAAGSAVGVGNLWRFPYLAAKDGGGLSFGNSGRMGRSIIRQTRIALSVGRPSRFKKEPGILPTE